VNAPADAITDDAREQGIDMIVIATHGYTIMKEMLLGGVPAGVLHHSPVPVHLIRPEA
jgi:nucleotide-binding universal stress UspA family protein